MIEYYQNDNNYIYNTYIKQYVISGSEVAYIKL